MKKILLLGLVLFTLIITVSCFAQTTYTNGGMTLTVPEEYADQVFVETPENDKKGTLFVVAEIKSMKIANADRYTREGAGWLFSINRLNEEEMHQLRCSGHAGYNLFAKDTDSSYYVYYHPTDVRYVRENYDDPAEMEVWAKLNKWSQSMRDTFISENEGLTAVKYSNTVLDSSIASVLYEDVNYTVSSTEYGPQKPNGIKAADYIAVLGSDVIFTPVFDVETPDGEYVVLEFPDIDLRYDFFLTDGKENYIRQVWFDKEHELIYKAEFTDESVKAADVMLDFYHAIVLNNSLGYTPDDMAGTWAEKIAGRGSIVITKSEKEGKYDIAIHWSSSAWQMAYWEMTAEATGNGAELRYENGKHSILTWQSEGNMTEEEVYTNGSGTFNLLSTYEVVWNDETGHAADDTVFINTGK